MLGWYSRYICEAKVEKSFKATVSAILGMFAASRHCHVIESCV